jgi:hypothetical protein
MGGKLICYEKPRNHNFGGASSVSEEDYSFAFLKMLLLLKNDDTKEAEWR